MKKLFSLAVALCLFMVACGSSSSGPIGVVKTCNDALIAKDFDTVAKHLYLEDESQREMAAGFIAALYGIAEGMQDKGFGGSANIPVECFNYTEEATDDPNEVIVHFESKMSNGEIEKDETTVINNNGVWQMKL